MHEKSKPYFPQEQDLAKDIDREIAKADADGIAVDAATMLEDMEARTRTEAATFGIPPHIYEKDVPAAIRSLAPALHRFEEEGGTDEEVRELFADVYPKEKIESDLSEVKRIERAIDRDDTVESKKSALDALVLEFIIKELANEWFPDCVVWKASTYDDIKRQTDLFMDVPGPEGGVFTLAIDVTYSPGKTFEKLKKSLLEFQDNRFHDVEYFWSDTDDERPRGRAFLPRVVTGASGGAVDALAYLYNQWRRNAAVGSRITKEQALERLRYHELAGQVYVSILRQVQFAYDQLRRNLKDTPTDFKARRATIKEHAQYMDAIRRSLTLRYKAWEKSREAFLEKNKGLEDVLKAPANNVLGVIVSNT